MSYAETIERLKKHKQGQGDGVPKVTKGGSGTSVTPERPASKELKGASGTSVTPSPQGNGENSQHHKTEKQATKQGAKSDETPDLEHALHDACRQHGLSAANLKAELVDNGDWPELTPEQVQAFVEAKARPQGSADELRAAIKNWCDVAGLPEARRKELLGKVGNVAPALLAEETRYFKMRIDQHERAKAEGAI